MTKTKKIISYILSVILVMFVLGIIVLISLNGTILSKSNIKKQMEKINYYDEVYDITIDTAENYLLQSGFDESIFDNVIVKDNVKKDIDNLIDAIYDGREFYISKEDIKLNLNNNINKYIEENNYKVDDKTQNDINKFEDVISEKYVKNIQYSKNAIEKIEKYFNVIKKAAIISMIVFIVFTVILAIVVYKLNKSAIGISLLATGLICVFTKFYSTLNIAVNNILIVNRAFSDFLMAIIKQILQHIFIYGILLTTIGVGLIIIFEWINVKYKKTI